MMKFELDEIETKRAQEFSKLHQIDWKSGGDFTEDLHYSGAIGGHIYYNIVPTSIGLGISVGCSICKEEINITNYESW